MSRFATSDAASIGSDITLARSKSYRPVKTQQHIPATDSSWAAYGSFVAALFSEGLLFGISLSFGVFQDYYTNLSSLPNTGSSIWIGILASGITFLGAPLVTYCSQHYAVPLHYYVWAGWAVCVLGLLISAFCNDIKALIATQGLVFGLGLLFVEIPTLLILNTWFVKRRGLAYGVISGLTDLFGVAWGFVANALLHQYGLKITFLVFTAICAGVPGIGMVFLRERASEEDTSFETSSLHSDTSTLPDQKDFAASPSTRRYYQQATFYGLLAANLFQSFAFYLPFMYLPSYSTALGSSSMTGAIVLAIANIAQVLGETSFGALSDKVNVHGLVFWSAFVPGLSAFFIWSFASSLAWLIPFALLFGSFGSGLLVLWPRIGTLFGEKDAATIYGLLSFGRGVGVICSGPISTALLRGHQNSTGETSSSVRHDYRPVVLFVGACMAASSALGLAGWVSSHWKRMHSTDPKGMEMVV